MQSAATELQSVEATLDAVLYNGTTNATTLAAEINAATQNITVTPFPPSTLTALNNSQVDSASHTIQSFLKVAINGCNISHFRSLDSPCTGHTHIVLN